MDQTNEGWYILGIITGAAGIIILRYLWLLCERLIHIHFEHRRRKREQREAIKKLEEYINED